MSLSSESKNKTSLLERLLGGSNYNVLLAVSGNIISWLVAALVPSKISYLLPFIPEEETETAPSTSITDSKKLENNSNKTDTRTRCVAIGRPGGMEQLRIIRLKQGYATCGYNVNLPGCHDNDNDNDTSPFVDVSCLEKISAATETATATATTNTGTTPSLVVLRIYAFAINYADCCIRWGLYESANRFVGYPIVPGFDVAGVVEQVIPSSSTSSSSSSSSPLLKVGDRVYGATFFGAYSTRCLIPANQLRKIPEGLSFAKAAALPAVSLTALYALHLGGRLPSTTTTKTTSSSTSSREDEYESQEQSSNNNSTTVIIAPSNRSILIHSAAGGVGSMMVQMAKMLGLSPVVGVVGRTAKVEEAKALGCDVVIDKQRLREEAQAEGSSSASTSIPTSMMWDLIEASGPPDGYSIIADPNGVSTLQDSFDHLCPAGKLVVFGFHSNLPMGRDSLNPIEWVRMVFKASKMPTFDPMELVTSNKSVLGFNLSFFANETKMLDPMYDQIERWLSSSLLRCPRVTEIPMDRIGEAHQLIQSGTTVGKLVMIASTDDDDDNDDDDNYNNNEDPN